MGIRVTKLGKVLGIDVVQEWPLGSTFRLSGLLVKGLDPSNTDSSHISNNFPTYASFTTQDAADSSGRNVGKITIGDGSFHPDNPLFGHLGMNYKNNNEAQTFTPEPVYVSGMAFVGVTQAFAAPTVYGAFALYENNLNELTVVLHEETDFELEYLAGYSEDSPESGQTGDENDPDFFIEKARQMGFARGVTSEGIRLTFPPESPLRFLTADTSVVLNGVTIEPYYENVDYLSAAEDGNSYGGYARTVYLRNTYRRSGGELVDVFGFGSDPETNILGGTKFQISGLTVLNVSPGTTAYTGYAPARPGDGNWETVNFGMEGRTPGLMLSLSSAGAVDAYLHDGRYDVVVNTGTSGNTPPPEDSPDTSEKENNDDLFNACLLSGSHESSLPGFRR
jgi:hypothetical protein